MTYRLSLAVWLALTALAGCDGDDDGGQEQTTTKPIDGTFVGKLRGTDAFMAIVASPPAEGQRRRTVTVFVCDARRLCEWLTGPATENGFSARAEDRDAEAKGKLSRKAATGSIDLPGGKSVRYDADRAAAAAGLYNLTVSARGRLRGASAAGVALTGRSTLPQPGTGTLKLADGTRLKVDVTRGPSRDSIPVAAGEVRVIVLPGGRLRGAGKTRRGGGGGDAYFFIRSTSR